MKYQLKCFAVLKRIIWLCRIIQQFNMWVYIEEKWKNCPLNMNMNIDSATTLKTTNSRDNPVAYQLVDIRQHEAHLHTGYWCSNRRNQLLYVLWYDDIREPQNAEWRKPGSEEHSCPERKSVDMEINCGWAWEWFRETQSDRNVREGSHGWRLLNSGNVFTDICAHS